ncbi:hypothetical protein [Streptomyces sp. YGL11-2]
MSFAAPVAAATARALGMALLRRVIPTAGESPGGRRVADNPVRQKWQQ